MLIKVYRVTLLTAAGHVNKDVVMGVGSDPTSVNLIVRRAISNDERSSCAPLSVRLFSDEETKEYEHNIGRRLNLDDLPDCGTSYGGVLTEQAFLAAFNSLLREHHHAEGSSLAEDSVLVNWEITLS